MANPTTNSHATVSVCSTPQNDDLNATGFAGLSWVAIGNIGKIGEHGYDTNMVSYSVLDRDLVLKAKGQTDGGNVTIECAENNSDTGQLALNEAADPSDSNNYAIQIEYTNGDVRYIRGPVGGPKYSGGGNEDFRVATYTIGANQILNVPAEES
jgi:hypothetical protein